jgi:hypothetical protein
MGTPVIVATETPANGLVVRWRRGTEDFALLSASRYGVEIHGPAHVDDDLKQWITDAERAHEDLKAGRRAEARALATHESDPKFGDLVPVKTPVTRED